MTKRRLLGGIDVAGYHGRLFTHDIRYYCKEWAIQGGNIYLTKMTDDYGRAVPLGSFSSNLTEGRLLASWYSGKMWTSTLRLWHLPILPFGKSAIYREFSFEKGRLVSTRVTWDPLGLAAWLAKVVFFSSCVAMVALVIRRIRSRRIMPPGAEGNMMELEQKGFSLQRKAYIQAWMTFGVIPVHLIIPLIIKSDLGDIVGGVVIVAAGVIIALCLGTLIFCLRSGKQEERFIPFLISIEGVIANLVMYVYVCS